MGEFPFVESQDSFGVEGVSKAPLSNPPAMSRDSFKHMGLFRAQVNLE